MRCVSPTDFVPPEFAIPTEATFGDLRLVPLGPEYNAADYAAVEIQGYASRASVNQGESIDFFVRTINTNPYDLSIYRIGWYNGLGGRLMLGPVTLPGVVPPPLADNQVPPELATVKVSADPLLLTANVWADFG